MNSDLIVLGLFSSFSKVCKNFNSAQMQINPKELFKEYFKLNCACIWAVSTFLSINFLN